MFKKLASILLIIASLLSISACADDNEFAAVPSTEEEARVVMTFEYEGERYEMKYELYRALFLNFKTTVDGGDSSVWTSDAAAQYIERADALIKSYAADIFAVLHIASKIGFDPYSSKVDDQIQEMIVESVNGTATSDTLVMGFEGNYEKYLEYLKGMNLNYSVQVLMLRYAVAYEAVIDYYRGTLDLDHPTTDMEEGALKFTDEDVQGFYYGNESARVLITTLDARSFSLERAEQIRAGLAACAGEDAVKSYILRYTATLEEDATDGVMIGKYSLDSAYYSEVTDAAFALSDGQTSSVIEVSEDGVAKYYILYRTNKTTDYYSEFKDDVTEVYISNEIGRIINEAKLQLVASAVASEVLGSIEHDKISMN